MKHKDSLQLATRKLAAARSLLQCQAWSEAYYLAGYAIEHALKAAIIKNAFSSREWPDKKFVDKVHTHDLEELMKHAGLADKLRVASQADANLDVYWQTVRQWSEKARYGTYSMAEARSLVTAIGARQSGILGWIKRNS